MTEDKEIKIGNINCTLVRLSDGGILVSFNEYKDRHEISDMIEQQIIDNQFNIERVNDMIAELEIDLPLELWLSHSKTWKDKAEKCEKFHQIHGTRTAPLKIRPTQKEQELEQQNKKLKEDSQIYKNIVARLQKEIFSIETQGWKKSEIAEEILKTLHEILNNVNPKIDIVKLESECDELKEKIDRAKLILKYLDERKIEDRYKMSVIKEILGGKNGNL